MSARYRTYHTHVVTRARDILQSASARYKTDWYLGYLALALCHTHFIISYARGDEVQARDIGDIVRTC
jgi:hypothetical protein